MKTFYTILAFTLVLFIASCGTDSVPDDNEFEPYVIGNWQVTSENSAKYVGSNYITKPKNTTQGDTVVVNSTNGYNLEVFQDSTHGVGEFNFVFQDSTVRFNEGVTPYSPLNRIDFPNQERPDHSLEIKGPQTTLIPEYYEFLFKDNNYDCESPLDQTKLMVIKTFTQDTTHFRTWRVDVEGFGETIKDISGCN